MNMTRQQAEHLLDAYVDLENGGGDNKARQSLREVILDAMASEPPKTSTYRGITYPGITFPTTTWVDTGTNPLPHRNRVTCCNEAEVER